jgi:hypothetical protein
MVNWSGTRAYNNSFKPVDNWTPGRNLCHLPIGLYLEGEPFRLASRWHHLVQFNHYWLLCDYRLSRRILSAKQIVGEGLPPRESSNIPGGMII